MKPAGKTRQYLARIAQDAGFLFSAGTLGVVLSATERYGISDAPLTSPLTLGAMAASLTSAFFAAKNFHPAHSMIVNAGLLLSGATYLLLANAGAAFLVPAAMMMSLGIASVLKASEIHTGRKTPYLNSEAFVGLGGMGIAYTMGGSLAALFAAGFASLGLYFSMRSQGKSAVEFFRDSMKSRACFMGINILSIAAALVNSDNWLDLKTLSGAIGPALLFAGNGVVYRHNRNNLDKAEREKIAAQAPNPAP